MCSRTGLKPSRLAYMVPSTGCEEGSSLNKTIGLHRGSSSLFSSSSSKSISSTSSSSSASPFTGLGGRTTKTMEEVWKDINIASLQDQETTARHHRPHPASNNNVILQDFLARPFSKDPPAASMVAAAAAAAAETAVYCPPGSLAPPPPATVLSLNSGCEFHFLDHSDPLRPNSHLHSNVTSFSSPFEALTSSTGLPSFGKKRVPESDGSSGDRRHKRMIKNRESAARSRARKQAYTNELELEVTHLKEENARLQKQQEQLRLAATAQLPKKKSLYRTSTAPF
ncbi:bZIP transcription factor 27 [Alnus glutinosa]|uniref:bZIP transcription factor 27 n=1 Tax=Alnus glutinosa TaxID=3517 RepID=UPI002D767632|nr:bZIP transcription factor 27 [Alnus glutinosa]